MSSPLQRPLSEASIASNAEGAVYAEYLMAGVPLFIIWLTVLQLSLIAMAGLVVRHAAWTAARAALVVLPDGDNDRPGSNGKRVKDYNGASRWDINELPKGVGDGDDDPVHGFCRGVDSNDGVATGYNVQGRSLNVRAQNILAAAIIKTAAVSLQLDDLADSKGDSVKGAFRGHNDHVAGNAASDSHTAGKLNYAQHATGVSIQVGPPQGDGFRPFTIGVGYNFRCSVPVADKVVCNGGVTTFGPQWITQGSTSTIQNFGQFKFLQAAVSLSAPPDVWVPGEVYP